MSKAIRLLQQLAQLKCKGLCISSCGPILISSNELQQVMEYAIQHRLTAEPKPATRDLWTFVTNERFLCPFLSSEGRCKIYPTRPMICRLFGGVEHNPLEPRATLYCPHGCTDEMEKPLTLEESDFLIDYAKTHNLAIIERRMQSARRKTTEKLDAN